MIDLIKLYNNDVVSCVACGQRVLSNEDLKSIRLGKEGDTKVVIRLCRNCRGVLYSLLSDDLLDTQDISY